MSHDVLLRLYMFQTWHAPRHYSSPSVFLSNRCSLQQLLSFSPCTDAMFADMRQRLGACGTFLLPHVLMLMP